MFQYLAFIWSDQDPAARECARRLIGRHAARAGWSAQVDERGLYVSCAGVRVGSSEPYLLYRQQGVVLGKLFERGADAVSRSVRPPLDERVTAAILGSGGQYLVERYWGRYVAIMHHADSGVTRVLRDPSAGMPCLRLKIQGVQIVCASLAALRGLGLPAFTVDWNFIAAGLCLLRQHGRQTGVREITQVLGGECLQFSDGRVEAHFLWNLLQQAQAEPIEDLEQATRALRACVRDCVQAWAGSYSGILLSLSGGLDSSIVFACLQDAPSRPHLVCSHYYPLGTDLDERSFARQVAAGGSCELIERPRDSRLDLAPLLRMEASHEPTNYLYYLEHSLPDARLAAQRGAGAVFVGWGGDQLFYQERALWAAGDYLCNRGLRPEVLRIALDAAFMDQVSVWEVLRDAHAQYFRRRRWGFQDDTAFANSFRWLVPAEVFAAVQAREPYRHPLLCAEHNLPSGKFWHVNQLCGPWEFHDPLASAEDPESVAPLYSQPLIELCLRLPVYRLTHGGWDRALARRAFQHELPPEVLNRRSKGGIEAHMHSILSHNRELLRQRLLDGALVREGLVDRTKLAQALADRVGHVQSGAGELIDFLQVELWLSALARCNGSSVSVLH